MILTELKSEDDFQNLNIPSDDDFIQMLKMKHPQTFRASVDEMNQMLLEDGCMQVPEEMLFDAVDVDDFLDVFEDLYFDAVGWESEEIIENYFVKDKILTDFGVWEIVVENGYVLNG